MTKVGEDDTKDRPGPLDAFETLQPGEKHFTLQGGHWLSPPMIHLWARVARMRAGIGINLAGIIEGLENLVRKMPLPSEAEAQELLLRASSAEGIAWDMEAYQQGRPAHSDAAADMEQGYSNGSMIESGSEAALQSLLRHRRLRACEEKLSNVAAELNEVRLELEDMGDYPEDVMPRLLQAQDNARFASQAIAPTRRAGA